MRALPAVLALFAVLAAPMPQVSAQGSGEGGGPPVAETPNRNVTPQHFPRRNGPPGMNGNLLTTSPIDQPFYEGPNALGPGTARGLILKDARFGGLPMACDKPAYLAEIRREFEQKESRYWDSALRMVGFDHIRTLAVNPWGQNNIPRSYCAARVALSDGTLRTVFYNIAEDQGIIGAINGVEWCVQGLDRGWSFDPSCRMARP